jgi:hypothetical protein
LAEVDIAHHVLRRRRHSKKTEAKRCGPEGAFHVNSVNDAF